MLSAIALGLILQAAPTAGEVVSQMLSRYSKAVSAVGTIQFTQSFKTASVTIATQLQYEKPSKVYLRQTKVGRSEKDFLLTSDGKVFTYNAPEAAASGERPVYRFAEPVEANGKLLDVKAIYLAGVATMIDRSAPLDIIVSRREDLLFLRDQWVGLTLAVDPKGYRITGKWRENAGQIVSGTIAMTISKEYDLLAYRIEEKREFRVASGQSLPADILVSDWKVDVKVDAPCDPALFTVVR